MRHAIAARYPHDAGTVSHAARLDSGRQRLESELHKLAEMLYKAEAPAGDPAGGAAEEPAASKSDDDVIDAEYTEEKGDS